MIPRRGGRGGCFAAGRCEVPARRDRGPVWRGPRGRPPYLTHPRLLLLSPYAIR